MILKSWSYEVNITVILTAKMFTTYGRIHLKKYADFKQYPYLERICWYRNNVFFARQNLLLLIFFSIPFSSYIEMCCKNISSDIPASYLGRSPALLMF